MSGHLPPSISPSSQPTIETIVADVERLEQVAEAGHLTQLAYLLSLALHQARADLSSAHHEREMRDTRPEDLWRPR